MKSIRVCVYHPSNIHLKAYRLVFSALDEIEVVGLFGKFSDLWHCLEHQHADLALIDPLKVDGLGLEYSRRKIQESYPRVGVVVIGIQAVMEYGEKILLNPVRGLVDFEIQSKAQIVNSIHRIRSKGSDFGLVRAMHPEMTERLDEYEANIPNVDERFWELMPLLATGAGMDVIASYFDVSRKTINSWIHTYCDEFELGNPKELLVYAANNQWVDIGIVRHMKEKLMLKRDRSLP